MLRKRLITALTFNNGVLFRTKLFTPDYRYTQNFLDLSSIDEIVVLDVTRPGQGEKENFFKTLDNVAYKSFVPITAGGGIRTLEDVREFLNLGADKVALNTGAIRNPELITEVSKLYGSQCAVISIDAKKTEDNRYEVYSDFGSVPTGKTAVEWAREAEALGAGEILLTSIDRDGWLQGFDLELCKEVCDAVSIPVMLLGGAGNWKHVADAFDVTNASGVCTQNIYHFTETSIQSAKSFLHKRGISVRM
ncbi:imidazole glycerol phosphate synthase subunit HisF [Kiloniella litopenaei]|uniref:imidazole glycerol phosphate synthase subunit HisF n=1 Tax=Kiloniella litopenaei TaxID=1549748 RepID=UPI003BA97DCD